MKLTTRIDRLERRAGIGSSMKRSLTKSSLAMLMGYKRFFPPRAVYGLRTFEDD